MNAVELHESSTFSREFDDFFNSIKDEEYLDSLWSNCSSSDTEVCFQHSSIFRGSFHSTTSNSSLDSLLCNDFNIYGQELSPCSSPAQTVSKTRLDNLNAVRSSPVRKEYQIDTLSPNPRKLDSNQRCSGFCVDNVSRSGKDCELEEVISHVWPTFEEKAAQIHAEVDSTLENCLAKSQSSERCFPSCLATDVQGNFHFEESMKSSSNNDLERQLASADNAWTAALDFPELVVDDIDLLLNGSEANVKATMQDASDKAENRLQKRMSHKHSHRFTCGLLSQLSRKNFKESKGYVMKKYEEDKYTNKLKYSENRCSVKDDHSELNEPVLNSSRSFREKSAVYSDETDTGSETEEIRRNRNGSHNKRRRKMHRIVLFGREEYVELLNSRKGKNDYSKSSTAFSLETECQCCLKEETETRNQKSKNESKPSEPWWPQSKARQPDLFRHLRKSTLISNCETALQIDPKENFINADSSKTFRKNRKKYELWEFILKSLNHSQDSAFRWVNREIGLFRISDTRQAAYEWGRYRGNSRMDYEKMARAMRFYYKYSVLRKGEKQLHFQFAMPFVGWKNEDSDGIGVHQRNPS